MASSISCVHEFKRQDTFRVDVRDVLVDVSKIGREQQPTAEDIQSMADSIAVFGQLQPVEVVKNSAGTMSLVAGFTRYFGVAKLNENTTNLNRVLLWVVVRSNTVQNAEDCLARNIAENQHRKPTTALDDAHNQQKLRELGWTNERIAAFYRLTPGRVSQLTRLLNLIPGIRALVLNKKLSCAAAEDLGTLDEAGQQAWLAEWTGTGTVEKANTQDVKESVAKAKDPDAKASMTMPKLRAFLKDIADAEEGLDSVKEFAATLLQFTKGEADETDFWNALDTLQGKEPQKKKRKAG